LASILSEFVQLANESSENFSDLIEFIFGRCPLIHE